MRKRGRSWKFGISELKGKRPGLSLRNMRFVLPKKTVNFLFIIKGTVNLISRIKPFRA